MIPWAPGNALAVYKEEELKYAEELKDLRTEWGEWSTHQEADTAATTQRPAPSSSILNSRAATYSASALDSTSFAVVTTCGGKACEKYPKGTVSKNSADLNDVRVDLVLDGHLLRLKIKFS